MSQLEVQGAEQPPFHSSYIALRVAIVCHVADVCNSNWAHLFVFGSNEQRSDSDQLQMILSDPVVLNLQVMVNQGNRQVKGFRTEAKGLMDINQPVYQDSPRLRLDTT